MVPKSTPVDPETNPVPETVTVLVPPAGPLVGLTEVTVGAGVIGVVVARASSAEVPLAVVTVTFTVPVPDGAMTVSESPPPATLMEVPGFEGAEVDGCGAGEAGAVDRDGVGPAAWARWSG